MHPCPSCMDRHIYWDHLPGIKSQASTSHGVSFQDSLASTLYINVSWFSAVGSTQAEVSHWFCHHLYFLEFPACSFLLFFCYGPDVFLPGSASLLLPSACSLLINWPLTFSLFLQIGVHRLKCSAFWNPFIPLHLFQPLWCMKYCPCLSLWSFTHFAS